MVRPSKRKVNTNIHNNVGKFPPHPLPGSFSHFSSGGELHDKENKGCVKNPVVIVFAFICNHQNGQ